jgi:tetratricopeptide (TPR) repeat protein
MQGCYTRSNDKFLLYITSDGILARGFSGQEGGSLMTGTSGDVEYLFQIAAEAANDGAYEKALEYLEQVLNTNPKHAMAWHVKGDCLDNLGKCEEALRSYDTAITLDPIDAETWFNKGLTLKKLGREKDSQCCVEEAVKLALGE